MKPIIFVGKAPLGEEPLSGEPLSGFVIEVLRAKLSLESRAEDPKRVPAAMSKARRLISNREWIVILSFCSFFSLLRRTFVLS